MEVSVFPSDTLLHVLDMDGLQLDECSSTLVLLEPNPGADGRRGLDRVFVIHLPPRDLLSPPTRPRCVSECALLKTLGVRRSILVPIVRKLFGAFRCVFGS